MLLVAGLSGLDRFPPRLENTIDPPPFLHSPPPLFLPRDFPFLFALIPGYLLSRFAGLIEEFLTVRRWRFPAIYVTQPNPDLDRMALAR